jgi:hypothetical protein
MVYTNVSSRFRLPRDKSLHLGIATLGIYIIAEPRPHRFVAGLLTLDDSHQLMCWAAQFDDRERRVAHARALLGGLLLIMLESPLLELGLAALLVEASLSLSSADSYGLI